MKIFISSQFLGGVGGIERAIWSITRALSGHDISIYANNYIDSGYPWSHADYRRILEEDEVYPRPWVLNKHWLPIRKRLGFPAHGHFDVHLHFSNYNFKAIDNLIVARKTFLVPCGRVVKDIAPHVTVLGEADGNIKLVPFTRNYVTLPPPVFPTVEVSRVVLGLPSVYFLTVFNPYAAVKGADILWEIADRLPFPIVWCMSNATFSELKVTRVHENVIIKENLGQEELRFLYENCGAYVSFSLDEGFGWSIADALLYGCPVISRDIGIISAFAPCDGLIKYDSVESLCNALTRCNFTRVDHDISRFSPAHYNSQFERLALG